ncbi:MAG: hypothetical protein KC493_06150 [Bacteriovoracaceae bacterium]|nr:hypothetical protein [Bacteriovoracaceae bacterium]
MKSRRVFPILFFLIFLTTTDIFAQVKRDQTPVSGAWMTKQHSMQTGLGKFKIEIHFEEINAMFAKRVLNVLTNDAPKVFKYFRYVPDWTVHFIVDGATHANGSATIFPTNIIHLNNFPPLGMEFLSSEEDWVRGLVIHELAHIIHMDQTSGIFKGLKNIFGSAGKALGSLHPHWFSEGLATWVETEFTHGGRLKSKLLEVSLKERLKDPTFCQSIDCLDDPGSFPGGSYRYWIGAWFLKSLEDKKPGTIRCLVQKNSGRTLFFLNKTFRECTGFSDVDKTFQNFKKHKMVSIAKEEKQASRDLKRFKARAFDLPLSREAIDWQKGFELFNDHFYHVQIKDEEKFLVQRDRNGLVQKSRKFSLPLRQIQKQTAYSREVGKMVISLNELYGADGDGTDVKNEWIVYTPKADKEERLSFKHSPHYVFLIGENRYLTLGYEYNHWVGRLVYGRNEEKLFDLDEIDYLSSPQFENDTLSFKNFSAWRAKQWSWHRININDGDHRIVMESKKPFQKLLSCKGKEYFKTYDSNVTSKVAGLRTEGRLNFLLHSKDSSKAYLFDAHCSTVLKRLKVKRNSLVIKRGTLFEKSDSEEIFNEKELDNYPNLDQFLPHYWYFSYMGGENVDIFTADTSLTDPKGRHQFGLAARHYTVVNENAPLLSYNYKMNGYRFGANYGKYYSLSAVQNQSESSESSSTYFGYSKSWGYWSYSPLINYSEMNVSDWISQRDVTQLSLSQKISYWRTFRNDFLQGFNLEYIASKYETKSRKDYNGHAARFDMGLKFSKMFFSRIRGTFEKLGKNDLASGVIYGGGHEGIGFQRMHEFYGLSYSSLFGNELTTGRIQFGAELFEPYSAGGGLLPFYIRELHALIGVDAAKADYTFIDQSLVRDELIKSFHAGARFDVTVFYNMRTSVDLIYAQVQNPVGNNVNDFLTVVTGKFSPEFMK